MAEKQGIENLDDLMRRCAIDRDSECWNWQFYCTSKGVPAFWIFINGVRKRFAGRRGALLLSGRALTVNEKVFAAENCFSLKCVNPSHCQVGGMMDVLGLSFDRRPRLLPKTRGNRTYRIWAAMKARCQSDTSPDYPNWGGRGIGVCDSWQQFENFLRDMGEAPPNLTIDRINNNGHYEPGNCRWATRSEQSRNTSRNRLLTLGGVTLCAQDWSARVGLQRQTILRRLQYGWSDEKALTTPVSASRRMSAINTSIETYHELKADANHAHGFDAFLEACEAGGGGA